MIHRTLSILATCAASSITHAQQMYDFINIGLPAAETSIYLQDIDAQARVLVSGTTSISNTVSYIWQNGTFTQIPKYQAAYVRNEAQQFGADGAIYGTSWLKAFTWPTTVAPWRWKDGQFTLLKTFATGGGANGIGGGFLGANASGLAAGWSFLPGSVGLYVNAAPALLSPTTTTFVGELTGGGGGGTEHLNDSGVFTVTHTPLAVEWGGVAIGRADWGHHNLGSLGGVGPSNTFANSINNANQIVGRSFTGELSGTTPLYHAFLWEEGVMKDLLTLNGHPYSMALDINDAGLIVGASGQPNAFHAVLWQNGDLIDLATRTTIPAEWTSTYGWRVAPNGIIGGYGFIAGKQRTFVLLPKP